jgi:hypothetical protein
MTAKYTIRTNCSATVDLEIIMEIEADDEDEARKIFSECVPEDVGDMSGVSHVGRHGSEITIDSADIGEVQEDLVEIESVEPIEEYEDEEEDEDDD